MSADEIKDVLRQSPFEPFRLVTADGVGYDIRHPDLLWVGQRTAMVGLTREPNQELYERSVKIDLFHVLRLEPLEKSAGKPTNGAA